MAQYIQCLVNRTFLVLFLVKPINRKVNALQLELKNGNTPKKPVFTTLSDILFQQHYFMIYLIAKVTRLKRMFRFLSDHTWDFTSFKKCFLSKHYIS